MYNKIPISDWQGWDDSKPGILLPPASFKQIINWMINKGRLYPFPKMQAFPSLPSTDLNVLGMRTFQDLLGNFHTLVLNSTNPYYLNTDESYNKLLDPNGNSLSPNSNSVFSTEVMLNRAFFVNGGALLSYVMGDQNFYAAGDIGTVGGTSFFLGKLASHLLMINCVEPISGLLGSSPYPARVRWSASGNPFEWNQAIDPSAGVLDIPDVEDQLTGWATIGVTGFAFRNNGITAFSPTGNGALPFYLENFSIGPAGVGVNIPYTLATYGMFCCFVALDDIYRFDGAAPQPIGGRAKKSIFKDIINATAPITAYMLGTLLGGTDYLSYWLACPQANNITSVWIFHFDSQSWVNVQLPFGALQSLANIAGQ